MSVATPSRANASISCKQVQANLTRFIEPRDRWALWLVAADLICFAVTFALALWLPWWAKPIASLAMGVFISRCFVLGHDAAHRSLFRSQTANQILARVLFLPSFTPCSLWEIGHNTVHHGFTNLKGRDPVWTPFDPAEFRALPTWRQRLERIYRTIPGLALYYAVELWWKKLYFPNRKEVAVYRREHTLDNWLTTIFLAAQIGVVVGWSDGWGQTAVNLFFAVLLPAAFWCWFMGFAIYVHHTHPSVRWFTDRREWSFQAGQLEGSVHMRVPQWFNRLAHSIFDHTAHHVDIRIPCYSLHAAQQHLESVYPDQVLQEPWSWRRLRQLLRQCQLYDYQAKRWTNFDGE